MDTRTMQGNKKFIDYPLGRLSINVRKYRIPIAHVATTLTMYQDYLSEQADHMKIFKQDMNLKANTILIRIRSMY